MVKLIGIPNCVELVSLVVSDVHTKSSKPIRKLDISSECSMVGVKSILFSIAQGNEQQFSRNLSNIVLINLIFAYSRDLQSTSSHFHKHISNKSARLALILNAIDV